MESLKGNLGLPTETLTAPPRDDENLALQALLRSSRFSFVLLAPICVLLGLGTAWSSIDSVNIGLLLLLFLVTVLAHMSVNLLNEYLDFQSGLDLHTQRTPFSGGTGFLPEKPQAARYVLWHALATLLATCLIGCYLVWQVGIWLLPLGIIGVLLVLTYTSVLNRFAFLCWVAPGLGFGGVMVLGAHYVLTGQFNSSVFLASLVVFFLVNNLLLLNQFPDIEADRQAGRRHLLVKYGVKPSVYAYGLGALVVPVIIIAAVVNGVWSVWALAALIPWVLSLFSLLTAWRYGEQLAEHTPAMAANVAATLLVPSVLTVALILS